VHQRISTSSHAHSDFYLFLFYFILFYCLSCYNKWETTRETKFVKILQYLKKKNVCVCVCVCMCFAFFCNLKIHKFKILKIKKFNRQ